MRFGAADSSLAAMMDPPALHQAAQRALDESRLDDARRLSLALIAVRPDFAHGYLLLGIAEGNAGRLGPALEAMNEAVRLSPTAEYLSQYARLLVLAGQDNQARQCADRAAALAPSDAVTLDTVGCVYSRLGAHDKAVPLFQAAVTQRPEHVQMRYNLASSLGFLGRFDEAVAHYEAVIAAQPRFMKAHSALSALRRQTPESNHIARLEALLPQVRDSIDELHLRHALAKEHEDLQDHDASFRHLDLANRRRKAQLGYHIDTDRAIFDRLTQRFAQADYFQGDGDPSEAPIFIIGLPRTGTTLADRILSSHPAIESAGELPAMPMAVKRLSRTSSRTIIDPGTIDAVSGVSPTALGRLYLAAVAPRRATDRRFIDKLPLNFLYAGFIARALPNAKLVCLRRQPLDSVWSNYKHLFATNFPYYNYSHDLLDTATYYVLFDRLMSTWRQLFPGRILELRYEALVDDLEGESRRLLAHCGLEWSAECLRFHENPSAVATPSTAQVRQPIYRSALGRWRAYERYLAPVREYFAANGVEV
jgi:tetratricopeptide (TPR) repeat protein